jgi:glycosyltransferase involved in cell wall biosynthesis
MDQAPPRVSVVIPCFNHGRYLDDAVRSAHAQTCSDLEVIVVDDGSTDRGTRDLLASYERPRTTVLRIDHQGPSVARNAGIARARGTYILPLDADDWIAPDYARLAASVLEERPEVGIVYCEAEFVAHGRHRRWNLPPYSFPEVILSNRIFATAMFRKSDWSAVGGYNSNMTEGWEDHDFWLSLIERGAQVHRIPRVLFYYRQSNGSRNTTLTPDVYRRISRQLFQNHHKLYEANTEFLYAQLREAEIVLREAHHSGGLVISSWIGYVPGMSAALRWIYRRLLFNLRRPGRP